MMRVSMILAMVAGLGLTACGDQAGTDHVAVSGDEHTMSGHGEAAMAPAPLPDDGVTPVVDVRTAWMRPHPQGRDVTAAYFALYLAAGSADRLVGARIDGADRVELHGHTMDPESGMMQMRPIGPQDVRAGAPLTFVPGGRHLMVFGLEPVLEGQSVAGVLVFERAGDVPVTFEVRTLMPDLPTEFD